MFLFYFCFTFCLFEWLKECFVGKNKNIKNEMIEINLTKTIHSMRWIILNIFKNINWFFYWRKNFIPQNFLNNNENHNFVSSINENLFFLSFLFKLNQSWVQYVFTNHFLIIMVVISIEEQNIECWLKRFHWFSSKNESIKWNKN